MAEYRLYFATNRRHQGSDRWSPDSYGPRFSDDGVENLRFGLVTIQADEAEVAAFLTKDLEIGGTGDGEGLAGHFAECAREARIEAFVENLLTKDGKQRLKNPRLGSERLFADLEQTMRDNSDVLIYIHGFNVSWHEAVGAALALQTMLQQATSRDPAQRVAVVLFTWPSDGMALPWTSYRSDRTEAEGSGGAVGRALLKARDYLAALQDRTAEPKSRKPCGQEIHLLCHSMGNFLLQHALARIAVFAEGRALPRLFQHIFLCAPDVDDDALEPSQPLGRLHELARNVTLYHNRGDLAMVISDYTKGNPDRLGGTGAARPSLIHNKIHQVDCTPIVRGIAEHSYYLSGHVAADIRASVDGWSQEDDRRRRRREDATRNVWSMQDRG
jgi:esterase/lipase superfamily enzyme